MTALLWAGKWALVFGASMAGWWGSIPRYLYLKPFYWETRFFPEMNILISSMEEVGVGVNQFVYTDSMGQVWLGCPIALCTDFSAPLPHGALYLWILRFWRLGRLSVSIVSQGLGCITSTTLLNLISPQPLSTLQTAIELSHLTTISFTFLNILLL
jgi:hypothetical protein